MAYILVRNLALCEVLSGTGHSWPYMTAGLIVILYIKFYKIIGY